MPTADASLRRRLAAARLWRPTFRGRVLPLLITVAIFVVIFQRIPFDQLIIALRGAEYVPFLALMFPNTVFYFCWDTLVLTIVVRWFHGSVRYRDLLPVRAASYVVAFFNTNVGRGALAAYLSRTLQAPFLQIGSTVIFLLLTEYTHLVVWATVGIVSLRSEVTQELLWVPPAVALFWVVFLLYARGSRVQAVQRSEHAVRVSPMLKWLTAPRSWSLFRTFRVAPVRRYVQIVLLRMPMFFVSLCLHYVAARTFGIEIPFGRMLAFLPVIFMLAALPITVAHLGTTQAAWIFFFRSDAPAPQLLAFSLAAHLTFMSTRVLLGLALLPRAYHDLVGARSRYGLS